MSKGSIGSNKTNVGTTVDLSSNKMIQEYFPAKVTYMHNAMLDKHHQVTSINLGHTSNVIMQGKQRERKQKKIKHLRQSQEKNKL